MRLYKGGLALALMFAPVAQTLTTAQLVLAQELGEPKPIPTITVPDGGREEKSSSPQNVLTDYSGTLELNTNVSSSTSTTTRPVDVHFIIDRSFSMYGEPGKYATQLVLDLIDKLPEGSVMSLRHTYGYLSGALIVPPTTDKAKIKASVRAAEEFRANSYTGPKDEPIASILEKTQPGRKPYVVYVGDESGNTGQNPTEVEAGDDLTRVLPPLRINGQTVGFLPIILTEADHHVKHFNRMPGVTSLVIPGFLATGSKQQAQQVFDRFESEVVVKETPGLTYNLSTTSEDLKITSAKITGPGGYSKDLMPGGGSKTSLEGSIPGSELKDGAYKLVFSVSGKSNKNATAKGSLSVTGGNGDQTQKDFTPDKVGGGSIIERIPFKVTYELDKTLPLNSGGVIKNPGKMGEKVTAFEVESGGKRTNERVVSDTPPEDAVIAYAPVGIKYETEYRENNQLDPSVRNVIQKGEYGMKDPRTEQEIQAPVTEIIEVGSKVESLEDQIRKESVAYETRRVFNPELEPGSPDRVAQTGVEGERTITESVQIVNGEEVARQVVSDEVTTPPVEEIIEFAPLAVEFETKRVPNKELDKGEEREVQAGEIGLKNPETDEVVKEPVEQVIEYGTKVVKTEEVPFEKKRVFNKDLKPNSKDQVAQAGKVGTRTIIESVDGETTEVISDEITTPPVEEIIEFAPLAVEFETKRVPNKELDKGEERETQAGQIGLKNPETDEVVKEPVEQVIEYGTKVVKTEEVPFEKKRVFNKDLKPGSKDQVAQAGKPGIRTIVESVDGDKTEVLSNEVTTPAVDEIIEFAPVEIPYETKYETNPNLKKGEERVKQEGKVGLKNPETGDVVKEKVDKIIERGTKEEKVVQTGFESMLPLSGLLGLLGIGSLSIRKRRK